jgi:type IV secretory pathway ATPase VirB11/archaellum biosynthesis ATPase
LPTAEAVAGETAERPQPIEREWKLDERAPDPTALAQYVERLRPWLGDTRVTELCINRPGEVYVERASGWTREAMPFATELWCLQFARLVAGATKQRVNAETPLLSAALPTGERLIVLEDAAELSLGSNGNAVRLLYSKEGQGLARVSAKQLLEASLRMRPDRILLAELRGEEAYYYLRNVNSGHPGSITSVHASSAQLAFEQLTLLVKEPPAGREMARTDVRALLDELVDVVVQCGVDGQRRFVKEMYWRGTNIRDDRQR